MSTKKTDSALRSEELAVGYGTRAVVAGVTLEVRLGQVVTLVGPNGAGKSTILKAVAGSVAPLSGAVFIDGRSIVELSQHEQALLRSVLLTERAHTELLTCEDVVGLGRYPHTGRMGVLTDEDRRHVREAMELLHVSDLADRDFMQLSDGQRQRVMLARALCQKPRLLVLDEPTSYLDIRYQIDLLSVLRDLASAGEVGIIMSLHELSLARQASDWVVCVKDGSVVAQGTPRDIFVPQVIDGLYDLDPGTYDPLTGTVVLRGR